MKVDPARPLKPRGEVRPGLLRFALAPRAPLELQILGRTLLHAALVGAACGLMGSMFFFGLELAQNLLLERLTGYLPLRAHGEKLFAEVAVPFRPWLLWLVPGVGALLGGLLTQLAPETRGGGADATIEAFHHGGGVVRRRVSLVKGLASILTLGSGGSGGREGPTIQIGGALGSLIGRYLRVDPRERRILLVAGAAAGIAAVFRTPLGAALLAVEMLYKDDFESDALIPALLASVVAYSVVISYYGQSTLFAHAASYPFVPAHMPLYALMAVGLALAGSLFLRTLRGVQGVSRQLPLPVWARPAVGGVLVGLMATVLIVIIRARVGMPGQGLGVLGGGYGAAQVAISGASWMPSGWRAVEVLALLGVLKGLSTALTVGTGGSAGDFGPSLVIGGLLGGAFGQAARIVFADPRIDPGAFALVGMGTFYGGIANTPISSLVMVCEMAGSYDLLVPLMLAEGVAFVALRKRALLYPSQPTTRRDSPAHRHEAILDVLAGVLVRDVMVRDRAHVSFELGSPAGDVLRAAAQATWQDVFPVLGANGQMAGIVDSHVLYTLAADREIESLTVAADLMVPPLSVLESEGLPAAMARMLDHGVHGVPVLDGGGAIVGFIDDSDVTRAYLGAVSGLAPSATARPPG